MPLETATYISGLNSSNPVGVSDPKSQGDDHLRLIKTTLLNTFPGITGAVTATHTELNRLAGVTGVTGTNKLVLDTTPTILTPILTTPAISNPTLSGTVTGNFTFSGTVTGAPTFNGNVLFSGQPTFSGQPIFSAAVGLFMSNSVAGVRQTATGDFYIDVSSGGSAGVFRIRNGSGFTEHLSISATGAVALVGALTNTASIKTSDAFFARDSSHNERWLIGVRSDITGNDNDLTIYQLSGGGNVRFDNGGDLRVTDAPTTQAANSVGFRGIPPNFQNGNYTLVLSDNGKTLVHNPGSGSHSNTIPPASSVAWPLGATTFIDNFSGSVVITPGSGVTLYWLNGGSVSNPATLTIAAGNSASITYIGSNNWIVRGFGT